MRNKAERKAINMRAGFGRAEITPPLGVELAGFGYYLGRKCESVRDPLYARAVLIEDGKEKMLLVSCDVLGLSRRIADRILEEAGELGISRDHVLIVSVHTHTGPAVIYHLGCGETDEDYLLFYMIKSDDFVKEHQVDILESLLILYVHSYGGL